MDHQKISYHHHIAKTKSWLRRHWRALGWGILSLIIILIGAFFIWVAFLKIPTVGDYSDQKVSSSTKIYDRTGKIVLYDVHDNIKRTVVSSDEIAPAAKGAVVAIEDKNFYKDFGIEPKAILRAVLSDILPFLGKPTEGGSTITQQLVKNTLLTQKQSVSRKIKEWVLAIKLDRVMTKDEILTDYLNEIPYGGQIYGIDEASQEFFGVSASNIDLAQAAYLAAIVNAPTYYSPYGSNVAALTSRKNLVLQDMLNQNMITQAEYASAKSETVTFLPQVAETGQALHFVQYIESYLDQKYGADVVANGGLKVITTLDWPLQQVAQQTIQTDALANAKAYNASNAALVAIDPHTGEILAMVGSRNYFDTTIDGQFNVALAGRQPGSSFKPIVYARAFEKGFTPQTVLFDIPTQFGPCGAFDYSNTSPCYAPKDYDGLWPGPISLRNALAQSRDVPAVQLLAMVGLPDALATAQKLGITTLTNDPSQYGLTLVLGGGEVTLLDMTGVYATFANNGVHNPPTGILEVDDAQGNVLEKYTPQPTTVMDPNAVEELDSVLSDNVARTPLFGANSFFYFGNRQVAGKTGTTNNDKDAWVFGYTPSIAIGVWSGNNDDTSMTAGSAISGPAWRTVMDQALTEVPYSNPGAIESFPDPNPDPNYDNLAPVLRGLWQGGTSYFIDTISGGLATSLTPPETKKEIIVPDPHNILYWIDPSNPTGPAPTDPSSNPQFDRWEAEFQAYISAHPNLIPANIAPPTFSDNVHTVANEPVVTVTSPDTTQTFPLADPITITPNVTANYPIQKLEYYLNGTYVGSTTSVTSFSFNPSDNGAQTGSNALKIVATDSVYNSGEYDGTLNFQ